MAIFSTVTITYVLRWIFVILSVLIVFECIYSLLSSKHAPEILGYFNIIEGEKIPITHWENIIGRSKSSDIRIQSDSISNTHALLIKKEKGWFIKDLNSNNGTYINGKSIKTSNITEEDDIRLGETIATIIPENQNLTFKNPISQKKIALQITIFQILTIIQLLIGTNLKLISLLPIVLLSIIMWTYIIKSSNNNKLAGFEMELMAFYLTTLNLAIVASSDPSRLKTEFIAIVMGIALMIFMCYYMKDIKRTQKLKPLLIILSIIAFIINLLFGSVENGAANWLEFGSLSVQPSEFVKIAFIFLGADTLENLYRQKNNLYYTIFAIFCLGCLAYMSDFGTALIFLAVYLVISFLRSGDFSRMIFSLGGLAAVGLMVLRFKPYIADRFAVWGHAWEPEFINKFGFQQTRTMSYGAGGGLLGIGAGNGSLKHLEAADTDLVFGFVMEEWGLIIAILIVLCIGAFALFAYTHILSGHSTFYTLLACGTSTLFLVQTMLNVFGSVDILPLTGVTFPFVSAGGSSMIASWAMLAYLKTCDSRNIGKKVAKEE